VTIPIEEARHPDHRRRMEKSVSSHSARNAPFGDIDFPTAFVEAVGPTFFEPWASLGLY